MPRRAMVARNGPRVGRNNNVVVVNRRPPTAGIGMGMATGMMMGAGVGLMAGSMMARRNRTKVKSGKIIVYQPFPGTLCVRHAQGEAEEFMTLRPDAPIPDDVKVVLKFGKPGTPIQTEEHPGHYHYSVIAQGATVPSGPNVKVIVLKLVEGTLVEIKTQDGKKQLDVIPPGQ